MPEVKTSNARSGATGPRPTAGSDSIALDHLLLAFLLSWAADANDANDRSQNWSR
jgi:hypothetical protein